MHRNKSYSDHSCSTLLLFILFISEFPSVILNILLEPCHLHPLHLLQVIDQLGELLSRLSHQDLLWMCWFYLPSLQCSPRNLCSDQITQNVPHSLITLNQSSSNQLKSTATLEIQTVEINSGILDQCLYHTSLSIFSRHDERSCSRGCLDVGKNLRHGEQCVDCSGDTKSDIFNVWRFSK